MADLRLPHVNGGVGTEIFPKTMISLKKKAVYNLPNSNKISLSEFQLKWSTFSVLTRLFRIW